MRDILTDLYADGAFAYCGGVGDREHALKVLSCAAHSEGGIVGLHGGGWLFAV